MKIAFIGQRGLEGAPQSIDSNVTELASQMVREGNVVISYLRKWYFNQPEKRFNGIILKEISSIPVRYLDGVSYAFLATLHTIFVTKPNVVHYYGAGPSLFAWMIRLLQPGTIVVCTLSTVEQNKKGWGAMARFVMRLREKASIEYAHATIATSKIVSNYAAIEYGTRAQYIPNGLSVKRVPVDGVILASFNLQSFSYILVPTDLAENDGLEIMLEAWARVRNEKPQLFAEIKLAFLGGPMQPDGRLISLREKYASDNSVVFTGFQRGEVTDALFAGARVVVDPSENPEKAEEVLLAMSYGKAVLTSDTNAHKSAVSEYGELFAVGETLDLAGKIVQLFEDQMQTAAIGHSARTYVENERNWEEIAGKILEIYSEYLALRDGVLAIR